MQAHGQILIRKPTRAVVLNAERANERERRNDPAKGSEILPVMMIGKTNDNCKTLQLKFYHNAYAQHTLKFC
jgi:hypothetical protein